MQCPQCHAENREGSRFCAECGAPLASVCPDCGFANYPNAKFCGGCGKTLSTPSATETTRKRETAEPERRQLTVMFCDLVGSTALAERLDPEELHELLAQYQDTCADVIDQYDGHIARYVGDGLLVYFGYPKAHEDDPQRAVRTGLGIVNAIKELRTKFTNPDVNLAVRIGIATGLVVAGDIGSGERREEKAIVGETPNLAARLQGMAEPNTVVIGASTQRLIEGLFDYDALGAQRLKGISQPVDAYRVRRERGVPERVRTPFVGRRAELGQFSGVIDACRETGNGQAIYVRGEAGIGKTRLVEEFIAMAEQEGFASHKGLVLDFGVGKGQDAIRTLVRSLLGVTPGSDKPVREAVAKKVLANSLLKAEQRVFLNDLLDLPQSIEMRSMYDAMDNATRNRGKRAVVTGLIEGAAARQSILVTVENVQWADPVTLEHLAAITAAVKDCPAVLLMTSRTEGDPLDQAWRSRTHGSPLMTVDLSPLRQKEAIALASAFIDASKRIAVKCIERAQGNPLFLEQLLRDAEATEEEGVPASIQSLVLARMDRLAPADKQAVQAASVIGQRFSRDTLQLLVDDPAYDCRSLIVHHLVRPIDDDYLFAHALIQEGVYASLLKSRRRELHRRVADWFAERDLTLRAQHLDRAEDAAAPQAYLEAAKAQASDYRYERARQLTERGLALAKDKADQYTLTYLHGELLHDLGSPAESVEVYRSALELADDDTKRCRAWIGVAAGMRLQDQHDNVLEALDSAETAARRKDLTEELARIHYLRGGAYFMLGKIEGCREQHQLALNYAREARSPHAEASALSGLGDAEYARGRMITARDYFSRCIELSREHGFGRIEVANLPMAAITRWYCNELQASLDDALAALEAARRVGHRRAEMGAQSVTCHALVEMGQTDRLKGQAEQLHKLARRHGSRTWEQISLTQMARALTIEGRRAEAVERLDAALEVARATAITFSGPRILGALALVTEDPAIRQQALDEGEEILSQGCVGHNHFWFYRDGMEVALAVGDFDTVDRYAAALEEYTRSEPLPWTDFCIARGRALANYGRGQRDDLTMRELQRLRDEAERVGFKTALPALERALENR
jgi:class 3 adenylate cyclase/tetratricopeptide (TPR) repeat protein